MAGKPSNMVTCPGCGGSYNASNPTQAAAHSNCDVKIEQA